MKIIRTLRFGEMEIDDSQLITFEHGLPGFEEEREFVIIPTAEESPYSFLQSAQTMDLAFLMTNPFVFFADYCFELPDAVEAELGLDSPEDIALYTLISIPGGNVKEMTTNLMAPVVINRKNRAAQQVVLEKSVYNTKHRLFPEAKEEN